MTIPAPEPRRAIACTPGPTNPRTDQPRPQRKLASTGCLRGAAARLLPAAGRLAPRPGSRSPSPGWRWGMIIFIIASGLTLVFGLMDVLNFGHGVFIALRRLRRHHGDGRHGRLDRTAALLAQPVAVFAAMLVAMAVAGALGWAFERLIVRPVYGLHLKQILITMGGMIVGEEIIKVIWGPQIPLPLPEVLRGGSLLLGDAAIEKYRCWPW